MRVLIVDDSVVFRSQIRIALQDQPGIDSIVVANNGRIALQKLEQGSVDVVTLDMEMPEMSGVETIRAIRKAKFPVRIIVFSAHTRSGSEATLDALGAGADDFATKPSGDGVSIENIAGLIQAQLLSKIMQFSAATAAGELRKVSGEALVPVPKEIKRSSHTRRDLHVFLPSVVVIGSSTGGPPALEKLLTGLERIPRVPILITQHMPPMFTATLAARLGNVTGIKSAEAQHQQPILPGHIYMAPGDFHFSVQKRGESVVAILDKTPLRNSVRPCVDVLFESAAKIFGAKTFGVILTGMGEDGLIGCRAIKNAGGGVAIQSKDSCVVFGMPGAVYNDGCYDTVGDLEDLHKLTARMVR